MKKVFNKETGEFQYEFEVKMECRDGNGNPMPSGLVELFKIWDKETRDAIFKKQIESENYEMAELLKKHL